MAVKFYGVDDTNVNLDEKKSQFVNDQTGWYTAAEIGESSNELSEILANGNTTGATDISVDSGQSIIYNNSSFTATISEPTLAANIVLTLPATTGTVALLSDITANNELTEILTNGNTTSDGQTIDALNGGGQLDLRYGSTNNQVMLSNDAGGFAEEGFFMEDDYISFYTQGYNGYMEFDYRPAIPYAQIVVEGTALERYISIGVGGEEINIIENSSISTAPNKDNNHVFIGSNGSSLQASVINSVVIGGTFINGKANNTVYVPQLGFYESGTIEGYLQNETLTADRNWSLPDATGTIALTTDYTLANVLANGATSGANSITFDSGRGVDFAVGDVGIRAGATTVSIVDFGGSSEEFRFDPDARTIQSFSAAGNGTLSFASVSGAQTYTLPASGGTVALTSDITGGFTLDDAADIAVNTTTGTKIGTGTTQKLGFWNATPVVQPVHIADPSAVSALTQDSLTDNSGGTANTTIAAITNAANAGSADVGPTADAIADIAAQLAKIKTDIAAIKTGADSNKTAIDAILADLATVGLQAAS